MRIIICFIFLFTTICVRSQGLSNSAAINIGTGVFITLNDMDLVNTSPVINQGEIHVLGTGLIDNTSSIDGYVKLQGASNKTVLLGDLESFDLDMSTNSQSTTVSGPSSISKYLKLSKGTLNSNGHVTLKSDASRDCLVHHVNAGGSTTGDFIVQRYISGSNGYRFIGPPTTDATAAQISDDANLAIGTPFPSLYRHNEQNTSPAHDGRWEAITNTTDVLNSAEGYALYMDNTSGGMIIDYTGPIADGIQSINLTNTTSSTGTNYTSFTSPEGWVLVSNPYCSPINVNNVVSGGPVNMLTSFYRWRPSGSYVSYNTFDDVVQSPGFTRYVPLGQAFFVRKEFVGSEQLNFTNNCRIEDPDFNLMPSFNKTSLKLFRLELVAPNGLDYHSVVLFHDNATVGFDVHDAYYILSGGAVTPEFATFNGANDSLHYSINGLPTSTLGQVTIPLNLEIKVAGMYEINLQEFSNFEVGDQVMLTDHLLNVQHNLNNSPYSFQGLPSDSPYRFEINGQFSTIDVDQIADATDLDIFQSDKNLVIKFSSPIDKDAMLRMFDVSGKLVYERQLEKGYQTGAFSLDLPEGKVYIIDIEGIIKAHKIVWN